MLKKRAFTLFEVIFTLSILAGFCAILIKQQIRSSSYMSFSEENLESIFVLKKYLLKSYFNPPKTKPIKKTVRTDFISEKIETSMESISKKSALKNFSKNIRLLKSVASWQSFDQTRKLSLITLILAPEEKKNA